MKIATVVLALLGSATAFPEDCPNVTVVHDVAAEGWYNGCLGLKKAPDDVTAKACEEDCKKDMNCSVWQFFKDAHSGKETCWSGSVVHGCRARGANEGKLNDKFAEELIAGQRLQHGFIKVKSTNKFETLGLRNYKMDVGTDQERISRCKTFCYTTITCGVWQWAPTSGCWLEHGPDHLAKGIAEDSEYAKAMVAGETIEHTCPPYIPPEETPWAWIITGIVLGLLALAGIVYMLTKKSPKVKKTRAVKIEPPKADPPVVYFMPYQPVQAVQTVPVQTVQSVIIRP